MTQQTCLASRPCRRPASKGDRVSPPYDRGFLARRLADESGRRAIEHHRPPRRSRTRVRPDLDRARTGGATPLAPTSTSSGYGSNAKWSLTTACESRPEESVDHSVRLAGRRHASALVALVAALTVTGTAEPLGNATYRVDRVVDGDTIELHNGQRVRLVQIDTPGVLRHRVLREASVGYDEAAAACRDSSSTAH